MKTNKKNTPKRRNLKLWGLSSFILFLFYGTFAIAQTISLQSFATGFSSPLEITNAGDSRLFVVEKGGLIKILNDNGTVNTTPFLDITSLVNTNSERGLLGLAFHPDYATNGYFFVNYSNNSGNTVIARYSVFAANPNAANPSSATILMTINQPYDNHNGGSIKFGPDGYLYIGMGDGGSGGDPQGYAQNTTIDGSNPTRVFLGKMLRIDVNTTTAPFYSIPATNPYVGQTGKEEIWAIGLRNPWKFSFDSATGNLWIADVGQNVHEEINKTNAPLPAGLNYGWRCYEGNATYNTSGCPASSALTFPLVDVNHNTSACSITGGYVYHGTMYPNLLGKYLFTDYCDSRIGMVTFTGSLTYSSNFPGNNFVSFGEDMNKELYIAAINNGTIYKITDSTLRTEDFDKSGFSIYPNPAKETITLSNTNNIPAKSILIYDISGKKVLTKKVRETNIINISTLAKGIYNVSIIDTNDMNYQTKLVVQ
ncbi:T9SS type A sorting domain-containing protein [Flavobacterium jejuense]|uniref:T9SS type A sorting domain-containing protein n=1 Tax=Flavobacterium jejuense TaxID=1544455 RepID=A0ABX0IUJ5_9FLAO|nr:PQQ-dependent sugar dehydrogenase [Flavobacterium jejuense]NHN27153.1 T9SS type A sorting domain-containing protein [Flavobacterium jejuense]